MFQAFKARMQRRRQRPEAAIHRCSDLDRLDRLRRYARDPAVRQTADARYRGLLVGGDASLGVAARVAGVEGCSDVQVLAYVARSAREESVRRAAMERVGSDRVLMEIALNDPVARLRRRAVALMTDPELLGSLAASGHRDDARIARDAARRLQAVAGDGGGY